MVPDQCSVYTTCNRDYLDILTDRRHVMVHSTVAKTYILGGTEEERAFD